MPSGSPRGCVSLSTAVLLDFLTIAVLAFIGFRLTTAAGHVARRADLRARIRLIVGGIRLRHVLPVVPVVATVAVVATVLVQVPGLDFGWWSAIGGVGNPVAGATTATEGTALERLLPLFFLTLLLPALPLFAEREEVIFRAGAERWSTARRVRRAVEFGLVHAVIGIPIGVALALSVGGAYFTATYLRGWRRTGTAQGALLESTRAHTAYNGLIVVLLLAAIASGDV